MTVIGELQSDCLCNESENINSDCVCDYLECGICNQCPENETVPDEEITLGGCYHSGLAYALGYDANGEVELCSKLFTNFNTGLNGGAVAAQMEHRKQFDPNRDIKRFIVALKPVKILTGIPDGENYKLEDKSHDTCGNSGVCEYCEIDECADGELWCQDCIDEDTCGSCDERYDDCECEFCDYEDGCGCDCVCDTKVVEDHEVVPPPLNAFARARWIKSHGN
jgi:hypothetical protein